MREIILIQKLKHELQMTNEIEKKNPKTMQQWACAKHNQDEQHLACMKCEEYQHLACTKCEQE
jgi:hypothetical protein